MAPMSIQSDLVLFIYIYFTTNENMFLKPMSLVSIAQKLLLYLLLAVRLHFRHSFVFNMLQVR